MSITPNILLLALFSITLTSCDLIGGIFEAGLWVGLIAVVIVVALVFFVIKKLF